MEFAQVTAERRSSERVPAECSVKVRRVPQDTSHLIDYSFSRDISTGGVGISTTSFFAVGDRILIDLERSFPLTNIHATGQITRVEWEPHTQMWQLGIMFDDLNENALDELYQLLEYYSA